MTLQLDLDFEPGLTAKYPRFVDMVAAVIYASPKGQANIAKELDIAPSSLNRMLNHGDETSRHFPVDKLPDLIACTGDLRPIYWLAEKFLEDPDTKRRRTIDALAALVPEVQRLIKESS